MKAMKGQFSMGNSQGMPKTWYGILENVKDCKEFWVYYQFVLKIQTLTLYFSIVQILDNG
jgi:hypothetical protein